MSKKSAPFAAQTYAQRPGNGGGGTVVPSGIGAGDVGPVQDVTGVGTGVFTVSPADSAHTTIPFVGPWVTSSDPTINLTGIAAPFSRKLLDLSQSANVLTGLTIQINGTASKTAGSWFPFVVVSWDGTTLTVNGLQATQFA